MQNKDLYSTSSYLGNPAIVHSQLGNRDIKGNHCTI